MTIQLSGVFWVIGSILQCASVNIAMLVVGRVIAGFAVGMASATVPLYQVWSSSICMGGFSSYTG